MQEENNIYCVILNYKNYKDTIECIRSVKSGYMPINIVVVDNCSDDGSVEEIKKAIDDITVIVAPKNLGYAGGNNFGIKFALQKGATHIWILNNDTVADKNAAYGLIKCFRENSKIGIAGSLIFLYDRPNEIWFAGGIYDSFKGVTSHYLENQKVDKELKVLNGRNLDYVSGCSLMISSSAVQKSGMFDDSLFLLFEEIDICNRLKKSGFQIVMSPESIVYHKVSRTLKNSPVRTYYFTRNRLMISWKHFRKYFIFVLMWTIKWPLLPAILKKSRRVELSYILKAINDFFRGKTGSYSEK